VIKRRRQFKTTFYPHVFSSISFGIFLLRRFGLPGFTSQANKAGFFEWWEQACDLVGKAVQRVFNTMIVFEFCGK